MSDNEEDSLKHDVTISLPDKFKTKARMNNGGMNTFFHDNHHT